FVLALSLIAVLVQLRHAARAVRRLTSEGVVGAGPDGSLVVADGEMLVAAAGLVRPRVLVSAGALLALDDDELRAIVDRFSEAWKRSDVDAVKTMLAEDAVFAMPPEPTWFRGREAKDPASTRRARAFPPSGREPPGGSGSNP
ncbi:MAG: nuclear transport factor 2 family protein, partial [Thermoplasmatota archaeon]